MRNEEVNSYHLSPTVLMNSYSRLLGALMCCILVAALSRSQCMARAVYSLDFKTLMSKSTLVFVGKVKSVQPSGIKTKLTYPTWDHVTFEWLKVEIEVVESIKGGRKGDVIRTLMLSIPEGIMANAPGIVDPKPGQHHLLFLMPTKFKGVYASATAPLDEDESVFLLDRKFWKYGSFGDDHSYYRERYHAIWSLVDDMGRITPKGAEELRIKYQTEISTKPPKGEVVHLLWKKESSSDGWQWNVPDEGSKKSTSKSPKGPVTKP
jgi:hypothetical protein